MGTTTPNLSLYKPAIGETGWGASVNTNWDTLDAQSITSFLRSWLAGMITSNNGGSPNTKIDISAGVAMETGNTNLMKLTSTLTKDISATWAVGSGNGGRASAVSLSANTWYHLFVIKRTDTSVVDAYFDTSVSAANIPSPYTLFRRIGSVRTNGSSNITAYTQDGDYFIWAASVLDVNAVNPGTAAVTRTLTVPTGVNVFAHFQVIVANGATAGNAFAYITDLAQTDEAVQSSGTGNGPADTTLAFAGAGGAVTSGSRLVVRTNTSSQVRSRLGFSDGNITLSLRTVGWYDTRGRFV